MTKNEMNELSFRIMRSSILLHGVGTTVQSASAALDLAEVDKTLMNMVDFLVSLQSSNIRAVQKQMKKHLREAKGAQ